MSLGETDIINASLLLRKGTRKRRASVNLQDFFRNILHIASQNLNPRVMERKGRRKSSERKAERAQTEKYT